MIRAAERLHPELLSPAGAVFAPEVDSMFTVCNSNAEALAHIKKFYSL